MCFLRELCGLCGETFGCGWKPRYGIDRAFYPERLAFQREVAAAQDTLARVVQRDEVTRLLTEELPPRLGAGWATLSLSPAPGLPGRADEAPAWNGQLIVAGKSLGRYWLGPRKSGAAYDADEQAQLQALVQQAALALAYADAFEALRALNRELEKRVADRTEQILEQQRTLAAFDERQKLARDLHDSVSQTMFSVGLSARALRNLVRRDPPAAAAGLAELEQTIAQAQAEMRALLVQLRGSLASQASDAWEDFRGLLASHCAALPIAVTLDAPPTLPLAAPLATELLQIVREALHNVVKHGDVPRAMCAVRQEGSQLVLTISDEGRGFQPGQIPEGHFGLRGIHERAAALNGRVEVHSTPGVGTVLRVIIPLGEAIP